MSLSREARLNFTRKARLVDLTKIDFQRETVLQTQTNRLQFSVLVESVKQT